MKKILERILCAFCLLSFALMMLILYTSAHSRIDADKQSLKSKLRDVQNIIEQEEKKRQTISDSDTIQVIQDLFETFPSSQYTIYVVVLKDNGRTIAISKNSIQNFEINDGIEGKEYLDLIESISSGEKSYVTINETRYLAQALEVDDYFIVSYRDNSNVIIMLMKEVIIIVCFIVLFSGIIVVLCHKLMKQYIFDDLGKIDSSVHELLHGNYETEFQDPEISELVPLVDGMKQFKDVFLHKSERMNRVLNIIGPNIGAFECLNERGLNFYSDGLWEILECNAQTITEFTNDTKKFKGFISSICKKKNEQNIVVYKNKHLEVYTDDIVESYVGVIIDRSKEENERISLLNSLEEEKERSLSDQLTGIRNRIGFQQEVEKFICDGVNQGTLLICDLDNFKKINDNLGHPEGDKVLKIFANCIKRQFRRSDILGRLGGDEFVVFIPNQLEVTILRQKLDAVMADVNMVFEIYKKYGLGVSIGAGMMTPEITHYKALYETADSALYVAKQMGKNQYFINSEGIRCMLRKCDHCKEHCSRWEALEK